MSIEERKQEIENICQACIMINGSPFLEGCIRCLKDDLAASREMAEKFDEKYDVTLHNEIRWILEDYVGEFENKRKCVDAIILKVKELIKSEVKEG